jgi:plastocyanin
MTTGGPAVPLNGCDPATAEDHTADAETTVTQAGLEYSPKCIRIAAGSTVKFMSTFAAHPLVGGEVVDGVKTPDGASPITMTNMGMEAVFTFPDAGDFGYYCDLHGAGGMNGAIFVE